MKTLEADVVGLRWRVFFASVAVVGVLVASSVVMHGAKESSEDYTRVDLAGVCGTLLGAGTSVASLGKTIAARGAGWVSAVIAAGCLLKDTREYQIRFNASPEGQAQIAELKRTYGNYNYDDWMREFGCTNREVPPIDEDAMGKPTRYHWDCSTSPYADTD